MYQDPAGNGTKVGDTSVSTIDSDTVNTSAYGFTNSQNTNEVDAVVLNKTANPITTNIQITHPVSLNSVKIYQLTSATAAPQLVGTFTVQNNQYQYTLPAYSVSTLVFQNGAGSTPTPTPVTPTPLNGSCGSANGTTVSTAPTTNLCNAGTNSSVTGSGPWSWSCAGTNGGTTANCSASRLVVTPTPVTPNPTPVTPTPSPSPSPVSTGGGGGGGATSGGGSSGGSGGGVTVFPISPSPTPATPIILPPLNHTLALGATGPDVTTLQTILVQQKLIPPTAITGTFDLTTQAGVRAFQTKYDIVLSGSPQSNGYGVVGPATRAKLNTTLTTITTAPTPTPTSTKGVTLSRTLTLGSKGNDVTALQTYLIAKGYLAAGNTSGYFGVKTQVAVKAFQRANNLTPVGATGPLTRKALQK